MRFERVELDGFGRFHQASWPLDEVAFDRESR